MPSLQQPSPTRSVRLVLLDQSRQGAAHSTTMDVGARGIDGIGVKVRELGSLGGDIVGATGKQLVLVRLKPEESFLKPLPRLIGEALSHGLGKEAHTDFRSTIPQRTLLISPAVAGRGRPMRYLLALLCRREAFVRDEAAPSRRFGGEVTIRSVALLP